MKRYARALLLMAGICFLCAYGVPSKAGTGDTRYDIHPGQNYGLQKACYFVSEIISLFPGIPFPTLVTFETKFCPVSP